MKAQAFTAATVPASRATDGNNFFTSYFRPNNTAAYWEGHLKLFEYNAKGEVLDKPIPPATVGLCALEDPLAPAQCKVGRLKVELNGYWDAANVIPGAAETGTRHPQALRLGLHDALRRRRTPGDPGVLHVDGDDGGAPGDHRDRRRAHHADRDVCRLDRHHHGGRPGRRDHALRARLPVQQQHAPAPTAATGSSCGTSSTRIRWWSARRTPARASSPTRSS